MRMKQVDPADVEICVDLHRRELEIRFSIDFAGLDAPTFKRANKRLTHGHGAQHGDQIRQFKLQVPFQNLDYLWTVPPKHKDYRELFIPVKRPPRIFRKRLDQAATHEPGSKDWNANINMWSRQTAIVTDPSETLRSPFSLRDDDLVVDTFRWNVYRVVLHADVLKSPNWASMYKALEDYNIKIVGKSLNITTRVMNMLWTMLDNKDSSDSSASSALRVLESCVPLTFPVRYQLEVCISHGYLNEYNVTRSFLSRLAEVPERDALKRLEFIADKGQRMFDPEQVFGMKVPRSPTLRSVPEHCIWQRSVNVTPTAIYFNSPSLEVSNRIIRQYKDHADRFLRVRFSDEKLEGKLFSSEDDSADYIFSRVYKCLKNGIRIGDRLYEYLASGNSQFREHGAYFFASTGYLSANQIRANMGDFRSIQVPAKFAARIGQCFSTTRAIGKRVVFKECEDVKRGKYNFTDGVGKISPFLAQQIAESLRLPRARTDPPSLVQFRLGGCKGVMAVWPDVKFMDLYIRVSQYKFPTTYEGLEIIRTSTFIRAQLNRQLINILTCLGVPDHVFVQKQNRQLMELEKAMTDERTAQKLLQRRVDPNQATLSIAAIVEDGFMAAREPFTISLLSLWRAWSVKYLKEKAQIDIDQGAFLLGCSDETATLKGHFDAWKYSTSPLDHDINRIPEIFLQIPNEDDPVRYRVIKDKTCVLARNPSLHPGDIRVVRAVDAPALHHLKNVVVFPQTGDRDIPNMCSGGDLDGDDYFISWDPDLIPHEWNIEAMDFEAAKPVTVEGGVQVQDVMKFFVNFMKRDNLGRIANAHLATADREEHGAKNEHCLALAKLHSDAVDFSKTGVWAKLDKELIPKMYPHFMTGSKRAPSRIYHSRTALGKLFDNVTYSEFDPDFDQPFDPRILDALKPDDEMLHSAAKLKVNYDAAMRRIMAQHAIRTEFEVWSTFVLDHAKLSNDYKFHEEIGRLADSLRDQYRPACEEAAGGKDFDYVAPFAVAMYQVTAREVELKMKELREWQGVHFTDPVTMSDDERPLISFPWLFSRELGKIAQGQRPGKAAPKKQTSEPTQLTDYHRPRKQLKRDTSMHGDDMITAQGTVHHGDLLELFGDKDATHGGPLGTREATDPTNATMTLPSAETSDGFTPSSGSASGAELLKGLEFGEEGFGSGDGKPVEAEAKPRRVHPTTEGQNVDRSDDDFLLIPELALDNGNQQEQPPGLHNGLAELMEPISAFTPGPALDSSGSDENVEMSSITSSLASINFAPRTLSPRADNDLSDIYSTEMNPRLFECAQPTLPTPHDSTAEQSSRNSSDNDEAGIGTAAGDGPKGTQTAVQAVYDDDDDNHMPIQGMNGKRDHDKMPASGKVNDHDYKQHHDSNDIDEENGSYSGSDENEKPDGLGGLKAMLDD